MIFLKKINPQDFLKCILGFVSVRFRFGKPNRNFGFGSFGIYPFWSSTVPLECQEQRTQIDEQEIQRQMNFNQHEGKYTLLTNTYTKFKGAQKCKELGGSLPTIKNKKDIEAFHKLAKGEKLIPAGFFKGVQKCKELGGSLPTIKNQKDIEAFHKLAKGEKLIPAGFFRNRETA